MSISSYKIMDMFSLFNEYLNETKYSGFLQPNTSTQTIQIIKIF